VSVVFRLNEQPINAESRYQSRNEQDTSYARRREASAQRPAQVPVLAKFRSVYRTPKVVYEYM
jgi:hypothetical protein